MKHGIYIIFKKNQNELFIVRGFHVFHGDIIGIGINCSILDRVYLEQNEVVILRVFTSVLL